MKDIFLIKCSLSILFLQLAFRSGNTLQFNVRDVLGTNSHNDYDYAPDYYNEGFDDRYYDNDRDYYYEYNEDDLYRSYEPARVQSKPKPSVSSSSLSKTEENSGLEIVRSEEEPKNQNESKRKPVNGNNMNGPKKRNLSIRIDFFIYFFSSCIFFLNK